VYRLGEVTAHSRSGVGNQCSVLDLLLAACIRLGLRFRTRALTDWTPVDAVSAFLVDDACSTTSCDGALHVLRPGTVAVDDLLSRLSRVVPLREVTDEGFRQALTAAAHGGELAALLAVLPHPDEVPGSGALPLPLHDAGARFRADQAAARAQVLQHSWDPAPPAALDTYVRRLAARSLRQPVPVPLRSGPRGPRGRITT
jgi:hypothetical protein